MGIRNLLSLRRKNWQETSADQAERVAERNFGGKKLAELGGGMSKEQNNQTCPRRI